MQKDFQLYSPWEALVATSPTYLVMNLTKYLIYVNLHFVCET